MYVEGCFSRPQTYCPSPLRGLIFFNLCKQGFRFAPPPACNLPPLRGLETQFPGSPEGATELRQGCSKAKPLHRALHSTQAPKGRRTKNKQTNPKTHIGHRTLCPTPLKTTCIPLGMFSFCDAPLAHECTGMSLLSMSDLPKTLRILPATQNCCNVHLAS